MLNQAVTKNIIPSGVVHLVPADLSAILVDDLGLLRLWADLTPLARNEWICWIEDAKKSETRIKRIVRLQADLRSGKRRPCCWPGCSHRERNGTPE